MHACHSFNTSARVCLACLRAPSHGPSSPSTPTLSCWHWHLPVLTPLAMRPPHPNTRTSTYACASRKVYVHPCLMFVPPLHPNIHTSCVGTSLRDPQGRCPRRPCASQRPEGAHARPSTEAHARHSKVGRLSISLSLSVRASTPPLLRFSLTLTQYFLLSYSYLLGGLSLSLSHWGASFLTHLFFPLPLPLPLASMCLFHARSAQVSSSQPPFCVPHATLNTRHTRPGTSP